MLNDAAGRLAHGRIGDPGSSLLHGQRRHVHVQVASSWKIGQLNGVIGEEKTKIRPSQNPNAMKSEWGNEIGERE